MARIIHSVQDSPRHVTPGERRLEGRLRRFLEDDYLVWYDVAVGIQRRYPDFILLHPGRGLLVLEVKDWKAGDLRTFSKTECELFTHGITKTIPSPLEQARNCLLALVDQLKERPELCHGPGPYEGRLSFPYGYGVVFPNITRRQWDAMLSEEDQELVLPARRLICRDEMTESADPLAFQERLWGMFEYQFGDPLTLPQLDVVRGVVFPEVRIEALQGELFEDAPVPDEMKVLELQQEELARGLGGGHRVIHGVAGSGKTIILGFRCVQLAESLVRPGLVLCYNISLAARLRRFIEARGLTGKIHVHHFHEWCGEMLRTYHLEVPDGEAAYFVRMVQAVIAGVQAGRIPRSQYGSVMIDEGHDFEPEWLQLVVQMVDPATDSFLLLYDDAQSIYRGSRGLGFSLSSVGVKAAGRTTILRRNYRNTREILKFAYDFAHDHLGPRDTDDDHIPLVEPETTSFQGAPPVFRRAANREEEFEYAARCVEAWLKKGIPACEIAVICFKQWQGEQFARKLAQRGIAHLWMGTRADKRAYDPAAQRVTVVLAPSSKGLEFESVAIIGIGDLDDSEDAARDQTRLLYVAMTRAKRRLAMSAAQPNRYVNGLEALQAAAV
ncbi:MAG: ATP-binding domain-containing protein [Akkermansiaceae bacterium]|nr:ATP-binding domain-containing protein [Akkermansiaceae bacterium]